jgi:hypothetical protein
MFSKAAGKEKDFVLREEETCDHKHSSKGRNMDYIIRWKHHKSCGKMAKNFQETANSF